MIGFRLLKRFFRNTRHEETLEFFKTIPLFEGLTKRELGLVYLAVQKRTYQIGEVLFREGEAGRAIYFVKSGQVELTRQMSADNKRTLSVVGKSHTFGEMALLDQMNRTATATVIESGDIYLLYVATLEELISRHPAIGVILMKNMAMMLSSIVRRANKDIDESHRK